MNAFTIGGLVGILFTTVIPYIQERMKDGRKFEWQYAVPALLPIVVGAYVAIADKTIDTGNFLNDFMVGAGLAIGMQKASHIVYRPKDRVSTNR